MTFRLKAGELSEAELDEAHNRIVDEVTRDGQRWISKTRVDDRSVLRMMVISYLTEECHLEALQEALAQAAQKLRTEGRCDQKRAVPL